MARTTFRIAGALAVLGVVLLAAARSEGRRAVPSHGSKIANFADRETAFAWADNVFVGTVLDEIGPQAPDPIPQTLFVVAVHETLKGSLSGAVFVDQAGGFDDRGNEVRPDGDPPLQLGARYMFVTKTHRNGWWHTPIPRHGDVNLGVSS